MVRNPELIPGVTRFSRSAAFHRKGSYLVKKKVQTPAEKKAVVKTDKKVKKVPGNDIKRKIKSRRTLHPAKVRDEFTAGRVVILLAGRHRGRRVVVLKALKSGLLMITGPYKVNGVPLRRVNQKACIATSTKLDIEVDVEKFNDEYFKKTNNTMKKGEKAFFNPEAEKAKIPEARIADQKTIDTAVIKAVKKADPLMAKYLAVPFTLKNGEYPHMMKF